MRDLQAAEQAEAPRTVVAPEPKPPRQRSLLLWVVAVVALLLAGMLAYVLATDGLGEEKEKQEQKPAPTELALASASGSQPAAAESDARSADADAEDGGSSGAAAVASAGDAAAESEGGSDSGEGGEDGDSAAAESGAAEDTGAEDSGEDSGGVEDSGAEDSGAEDSGAEDSGAAEESGGDSDAKKPESGGGSLPKRLSYRDFASRMARASPKSRCSKFGMPGMKVRLKVTVGPNGRVKKSTPTGSQSGSSLGACVAKSVRRLKFPKSRKGGTFRYTYKL